MFEFPSNGHINAMNSYIYIYRFLSYDVTAYSTDGLCIDVKKTRLQVGSSRYLLSRINHRKKNGTETNLFKKQRQKVKTEEFTMSRLLGKQFRTYENIQF